LNKGPQGPGSGPDLHSPPKSFSSLFPPPPPPRSPEFYFLHYLRPGSVSSFFSIPLPLIDWQDVESRFTSVRVILSRRSSVYNSTAIRRSRSFLRPSHQFRVFATEQFDLNDCVLCGPLLDPALHCVGEVICIASFAGVKRSLPPYTYLGERGRGFVSVPWHASFIIV